MRRPDPGTLLVATGVALLVATLGMSAVTAPTLGVAGGADDDRRTLVGVQGGGTGWHEHGSVTAYEGREIAWREGSAGSYFEVTHLPNGSVLAAFMNDGYTDCGPYDAPCTRTGFRIVDPTPQPRVVSQWSLPVRTATNSEVHAVEPLPSGGVLVTDMEHERLAIVKGGEVTWEWNASSFYEAPSDPTRTDWLHINDAERIGDGRYMVSVRNANQILIVERGRGVVEVINEDRPGSSDRSCRGQLVDADGDGDIRCGDPAILDHQHNPQWLGDGAVLVADSDNDRVVELHRTDGEWRPVWSLERANGVPLDWPRDADRLPNGNTLITDTLNRRVVEIDQDGDVVWSVTTEYVPYEADRLPFGESQRAPPLDAGGETVDATDDDVPVLSTLLTGVYAVAPWIPFWYAELQLGLTLASIGLVAVGAVLRYRCRR